MNNTIMARLVGAISIWEC